MWNSLKFSIFPRINLLFENESVQWLISFFVALGGVAEPGKESLNLKPDKISLILAILGTNIGLNQRLLWR